MLVDSHTHLNFKAFNKDWQKVVRRSKKARVKKMVVVGVDLSSSQRAIEIAQQTEGVVATVGVHPVHCQELKNIKKTIKRLEKLAKRKKVVGIGECGLDYFRGDENKDRQKRLFGAQIQLAKEQGLPMVIHNRQADEEVLDVIDHYCKLNGKYPKAVFHCISGSEQYLRRVLSQGFYIGVGGNTTYNQKVQELVKLVPLERLMLETDAPCLMPEPLRQSQDKNLRNEPANVTIVAEFVAKLKQVSLNKVKTLTTRNAEVLFNI